MTRAHNASTYARGCRCTTCTTAHTTRVAAYRDHRYDQRTLDDTGRLIAPGPRRHGRNSTYIGHGCRCQPCTTAHTQAARERNTP